MAQYTRSCGQMASASPYESYQEAIRSDLDIRECSFYKILLERKILPMLSVAGDSAQDLIDFLFGDVDEIRVPPFISKCDMCLQKKALTSIFDNGVCRYIVDTDCANVIFSAQACFAFIEDARADYKESVRTDYVDLMGGET